MRARELGIEIGPLASGPADAITDVGGVRVGHTTLIEGDDVRTGVTVVLPHGGNPGSDPVFAGCHTLNGRGELTGLEWVRESGLLSTPVGLTNTCSVGVVRDALIAADLTDELPVVGETWDGSLNDIRGMHVRAEPSTPPWPRPPGSRRAPRSPRAPSVAAPAWSATGSRAASAPPRGWSPRRTVATPSACWCKPTTAAAGACGSTACRSAS